MAGRSNRRALSWFVCVLVILGVSHAASAATFTDNFDMKGNYTQYLYSTYNAAVWNETPSFPDVWYWAPVTDSVWANVVYKYQLPGSITHATLQSPIMRATNYDPAAKCFVEVSRDGVNWTMVVQDYMGSGNPATNALDISSVVNGWDSVYVRANLYETRHFGNIHYAQFIRTSNGYTAPNMYQFQATYTPVPAPMAAWAGATLLGSLGMIRLRRRFAK